MTGLVVCALCRREHPADDCEQSIRGFECTRCIDKKVMIALRKLGGVVVDDDGTMYIDMGKSDDGET